MSNTSVSIRQRAPTPTGRPYGGVSDVDRRAERRARFLEAAIVVIGRDGFANTTTRSLCAEAGLTQRYFYESFEGIEPLFDVVLRHLGHKLERAILGTLETAPDDPELRTRAVIRAYFETMRSDPNAARILLAEVYTAGPRTGELAFRFSARVTELLRAGIDAAFPAISRRGIHSGLMAAGLVGATHHIALKWMLSGFAEPIDVVVETATSIYMGPLTNGN